MRKYCHLIIFFGIGAAVLMAEEDAQTSPADQVITREQIEEAGLNRLSDLLFLLDDWDYSTIDGFSWRATANGLSAPQRQNWLVFIDGQRIPLTVFDTINLNRLPLSMNQVERVEVFSSPRLTDGEFVENGSIHFITKEPERGLSYHGFQTFGNKTGDPGPYRYTKYKTNNVDRIGADNANLLSFRRKKWLVQGEYITQVSYPTNTRMIMRNRRISDGKYPLIKMEGYYLNAAFETLGGSHSVTFSGSTLEDYFYFKPYGREIPLLNRFENSGIDGTFRYDEKTFFKYRTAFSSTKFDKRPNSYDINFDWNQRTSNTDFEVVYSDEQKQGVFGLGYETVEARSDYLSENKNLQKMKVFGQINWQARPSYSLGLDFLARIISEKIALKMAIRNKKQLTANQYLSADIAFSQRFFEEDDGYWQWTGKGYDILNDLGVDYELENNYPKSSQISSNISWFYSRKNFSIKTTVNFRSFDKIYLENQRFQYRSWDKTFSAPLAVSNGNNGQLAGAKTQLKVDWTPQLKNKMVYRFQKTVSGSGLFKDQQEALPVHTFKYQISYHPAQSFSLWAMFSYYSQTRWVDFDLVDQQSSGLYKSKLSSKTNLDIAAQKWFWDKRIFGNLLFRNVFNSEQIYHPIGATMDLRFHIQLGLQLDSVI